jgi:predicted lipoprotein with Yx(FWY)xxD motif
MHNRSFKFMRTRRWVATVPFGFAAAGLIATGCGASTSRPTATGGSGYGATPTTTAPPAPPAAGSAITVGHTSLGSIITDGQGQTVYLFEKDTGTTSTCYGACAAAWPPVTTTAGQSGVSGGANQTLLGTTMRTDGTTQLTYAGHPLYRFAGDHKPGDTIGQGLKAFGAGWYVLAPTGQKIDNGR